MVFRPASCGAPQSGHTHSGHVSRAQEFKTWLCVWVWVWVGEFTCHATLVLTNIIYSFLGPRGLVFSVSLFPSLRLLRPYKNSRFVDRSSPSLSPLPF